MDREMALSGWVFIPYLDSPGNDIQQMGALKNQVDMLKISGGMSRQSRQEKCVAFNTDGWMKHTLLPREKWYRWTADPKQGLWVRREALEALDWQFFEGLDSEGNDIKLMEDFAGNSSQLMYYVNTEMNDCVAFNTNGWLKHTLLPRKEWVQWSGSSSEGLWVKKSALESLEWVFVPYMDSDGNDIKWFEGDAEERKKFAVSLREKCVAYNTNGWMKHTLQPRDRWIKWTDNSREGMYVKRSAMEKIDWEFIPHMESLGNDITFMSTMADDSSALLRYVNEREPSCVAFSTSGFLKRAIAPRDQWIKVSSSPFRGLWVRRSVLQQIWPPPRQADDRKAMIAPSSF